jgi:hypothetical protein
MHYSKEKIDVFHLLHVCLSSIMAIASLVINLIDYNLLILIHFQIEKFEFYFIFLI